MKSILIALLLATSIFATEVTIYNDAGGEDCIQMILPEDIAKYLIGFAQFAEGNCPEHGYIKRTVHDKMIIPVIGEVEYDKYVKESSTKESQVIGLLASGYICSADDKQRCQVDIKTMFSQCIRGLNMVGCMQTLSKEKQCFNCMCSTYPGYCPVKELQASVKQNIVQGLLQSGYTCSANDKQRCQVDIKDWFYVCLKETNMAGCMANLSKENKCYDCMCSTYPGYCPVKGLQASVEQNILQSSYTCSANDKQRCQGDIKDWFYVCIKGTNMSGCMANLSKENKCYDCMCSNYPGYCPVKGLKASVEQSIVKGLLQSGYTCSANDKQRCQGDIKDWFYVCLKGTNMAGCMANLSKENKCYDCMCSIYPGYCPVKNL